PRRTFECLDYLIANRDRAVGRDELVSAIFGRPNVSDAQLGQIVLRTRRVVDDDGNAQHAIRTIPGFGYRWIADVRDGAVYATSATTGERDAAQPTHIDATATNHSQPTSSAEPVPDRRRKSVAFVAAM